MMSAGAGSVCVRCVCLLIAVWLCVCAGTVTAQSAVSPSLHPPSAEAFQPPSYKPLRYDENNSYFADTSKQVGLLDRLKYISLGQEGWYLSLGGETRQRYEFIRGEEFSFNRGDSHGINQAFLQRYMGHADLHLGEHLRVFGQLKSTLEDGRADGPRPQIDQNTADIHQAFLDWRMTDGIESDSLTMRGGRQEMSYGSGRLIDVREGPTNRLAFDGVKMLVHTGELKVDGFWTRPVESQPEAFDDMSSPDRSLWGIYAVHPIEYLENATIDVYYLGTENREARYFQDGGYELRNTLGVRLQGKPESGWEYNYEGMWQFGKFANGHIQAWSIASETRCNFREFPFQPRLGLRADVASGDGDPLSSNLNTFSALYPSGAYFNLADPIGPSNMVDLHPILDLHFTEKIMLSMDWDFFWRQSLNDGAYFLSGRPIEQSGPSDARFIGNSPAITLVFNPTRHLTFFASYVHFEPGRFIRDTTPGSEIDYFTFWGTYKF